MSQYVTNFKPRDFNDFEKFTFEEAYELIQVYSRKLWPIYVSLHRIMSVEDVAQEIATSVWRRKAQKNITRISKRYFTMIIVKRWYIDLIKFKTLY